MDLAAKFLEDQEFMDQFLQKSHKKLLQSRLMTEKLLEEAGIGYHEEGYAPAEYHFPLEGRPSVDKPPGTRDSSFGSILRLICLSTKRARTVGQPRSCSRRG